MKVGCYPGSFDPPTVAHLAIADAARRRHDLDRIDLVISRIAIGKERSARTDVAERHAVLEAVAANLGWLGVVVSEFQLVTELAQGYDVVIMGADKWHQVNDPQYYGASTDARDAAVARLPMLAIAPRSPYPVPEQFLLDLAEDLHDVSSTAARAGRTELMLPEALERRRSHGTWG